MKDVSAKEFIDAFAKHLKKGNRVKIPEVGSNFTKPMKSIVYTSPYEHVIQLKWTHHINMIDIEA